MNWMSVCIDNPVSLASAIHQARLAFQKRYELNPCEAQVNKEWLEDEVEGCVINGVRIHEGPIPYKNWVWIR